MSESNPKVTSKFDRDHGKPRHPTPVSHPGAVAPQTGTTVPGHNENGHAYPSHTGKKLNHD